MIKAVGQCEEGPLVLLGLSRENTKRLHQGQPIRFNLRDITGGAELPSLVVCIVAGETERELHLELKKAGVVDGGTAYRIGPGRHGKPEG